MNVIDRVKAQFESLGVKKIEVADRRAGANPDRSGWAAARRLAAFQSSRTE